MNISFLFELFKYESKDLYNLLRFAINKCL